MAFKAWAAPGGLGGPAGGERVAVRNLNHSESLAYLPGCPAGEDWRPARKDKSGRSRSDMQFSIIRTMSPENSRVEGAGYARQRAFGSTGVCVMPDNSAEPVASARLQVTISGKQII